MTINLLKILRSRNDVAIPAERAPRQKNNGLVVPTLIFLRQNDKANFFSPQPWRGRAVLVRGRPHRLWPCWAGRRERPPLEYRTHRPCSQPWPLSSADFALTARPVGITVPPYGQHGCPGHDPECRQRCQARAPFGAVVECLVDNVRYWRPGDLPPPAGESFARCPDPGSRKHRRRRACAPW